MALLMIISASGSLFCQRGRADRTHNRTGLQTERQPRSFLSPPRFVPSSGTGTVLLLRHKPKQAENSGGKAVLGVPVLPTNQCVEHRVHLPFRCRVLFLRPWRNHCRSGLEIVNSHCWSPVVLADTLAGGQQSIHRPTHASSGASVGASLRVAPSLLGSHDQAVVVLVWKIRLPQLGDCNRQVQ